MSIAKRSDTFRAAVLYGAIWSVCVAYLASRGGNFLFPISSLILFGIVLTGVAIFLTRKTAAPPVPVARPRVESLAILAYLVIYAAVFFGPLSGWIRNAVPAGSSRELTVLAYKLVVHLALPALLIKVVGGSLSGIFDGGLKRRGVLVTLAAFCVLMIVVVGLLNSIFEQLAARGLSTPAVAGWLLAAWAWMSVEVGVTEEFLFRGLLQSRLTAWIGSAPFAIVATAIVFALVHVPAFYLRGGEEVAKQAANLPQIIALTIAALGPIGIMLGTLWHRTRSFLLMVLVHGAIDTMPNIEKMIRIWS
ncbi:MAG TPA: CPBP family intramembrane glutamic endopeptidase [Thermoanaerobaculia bacterium]|nr:CPBP family intramembrane glutamic endopeptidase [Thermoanaerobaculia bacterium]